MVTLSIIHSLLFQKNFQMIYLKLYVNMKNFMIIEKKKNIHIHTGHGQYVNYLILVLVALTALGLEYFF